MLDDFCFKDGFISVMDLGEYGEPTFYALVDREKVEAKQKELISQGIFREEMIGDLRSESFDSAFRIVEPEYRIEIDEPKSPADLIETVKEIQKIVDMWKSNDNLILHWY